MHTFADEIIVFIPNDMHPITSSNLEDKKIFDKHLNQWRK